MFLPIRPYPVDPAEKILLNLCLGSSSYITLAVCRGTQDQSPLRPPSQRGEHANRPADHPEKYRRSSIQGEDCHSLRSQKVGKTTLIQELRKSYPDQSIYLNCDEPDIPQAFTNVTSTEIRAFIGDKRLVFLDEAQRGV